MNGVSPRGCDRTTGQSDTPECPQHGRSSAPPGAGAGRGRACAAPAPRWGRARLPELPGGGGGCLDSWGAVIPFPNVPLFASGTVMEAGN